MKTCQDCPWFKPYGMHPPGSCFAEPKTVERNANWIACHYYLDYVERLGLTDKPEAEA